MTGIKIRTGVEFRGSRSEQSFKAGGVGLSRKPKDQTKNSFSNRQIVNTLPFSAFFTKNDNANKIDLTPIFTRSRRETLQP
jgi:hypothetical protein